MKSKSINLLCTIGTKPVSHKSVKSLEIERNFSDVANKFTMTLIDTPQTKITDLELYMCAGNRTISIAYSDNPDASGLVSFRGQVWDYTSTFVGNIKQLTISGNVTQTTSYDQSGTALYNIDWNSYFCMRVDTTKPWNVNLMMNKDQSRYATWKYNNEQSFGTDESRYTMQNQNVVFYENFSEMYKQNAITVKISGPGGSIDLPVPDSFAPLILSTKDNEEDYEGDDQDSKGRLWGLLSACYYDPYTGNRLNDPKDPNACDIMYIQETDKVDSKGVGSIRAFTLAATKDSYIQLNPSKEYYGAGTFLNSSLGVDPSYIVKQLCKLEGWPYTSTSIVQTATVPNSDSFKMNNMSAMDFIQNVLVPVSITPVGDYTDKSGNKVSVSQGNAGFTCWFDSKGYFHYEPLTNLYKRDKRNISLGYNIPNSPVISFQVDTKGTCFYTTNAVQVNSVSLVTGKEITSIDTTQSDQVDAYNKVSGHNENLDNFFGYTYEQIQELYDLNDTSAANGLYLGFGDANIVTSLDSSEYNETLSTSTGISSDYVRIVSSEIQKNLVTYLASSAVAGDISIQLKNAASEIEEFMISATMTLWGDIRLSPASVISVLNMVKSTDEHYTTKHPTSGDYLITKQVDKITDVDFTQTLSLIRTNASLTTNINPQNIDYSIPVKANMEKTPFEIREEERATIEFTDKDTQESKIVKILNMWDMYMEAIASKHPEWKWWRGDHPSLCCDLMHIGQLKTHGKTTSGTVYHKATGSDPTASWYTIKDGLNIYNTRSFEVDPLVMAWYEKAYDYFDKNKLGTKVLHQPQSTSSCPSGIEYDLPKGSSSGDSPNSGYTPPLQPYDPNNNPLLNDSPLGQYKPYNPLTSGQNYGGFYQNQSNSLYQGGLK